MEKQYNLKSVNMISPKYEDAFNLLNKTLKSIVIPSGTTRIYPTLFEDNLELESVIVPEGVTHIEYSAFSNCPKLSYLELPNSLEILYNNVFDGCSSLKNIIFHGTMEQWNDAITYFTGWKYSEATETVTCSDGIITVKEAG